MFGFSKWRTSTKSVQKQSSFNSFSRGFTCGRHDRIDWNKNDDFFRFTRGRFVCDEAYQMQQRHIKFDVNELARLAAKAANAGNCVNVKKCPDGFYNKALLITLDTGAEVIAKILNPNAGIPHLTIASEAATMEFNRTVLGIPVPAVLAYDSNRIKNSVGAPYIIMEKVKGVPLEQLWAGMEVTERWTITQSLAKYQKAWTSISFRQYGSLYFREDLQNSRSTEFLYKDDQEKLISDLRFAIGPSTGREWVDDGRCSLDFDRGPCKMFVAFFMSAIDRDVGNTAEQYVCAYANREAICARNVSKLPKSPISLHGPGTYIPSRNKKILAAECFRKLIEFILPQDTTIATSNMWHTDLHAENIFVDPMDNTKIVGIIDWQSVELAPLFHHAHRPALISFNGPEPEGLGMPKTPDGHEDTDPEVRKAARHLWLEQCVVAAYNTYVHGTNERLWRVKEFHRTESSTVLTVARNLLVDGEAVFLLHILELEAQWSELTRVLERQVPYPLQFTDLKVDMIRSDAEGSIRAMELMQKVKDTMGKLFPDRSVVPHHEYEQVKRQLRELKTQIKQRFAESDEDKALWDELWPFDD